MKQTYNTALYMRLSRDDENYGTAYPSKRKEPFCANSLKKICFMLSTSMSMTDGAERTLNDRISSV